MGLESRVLQFYTICDKNQLLNKNIGKVMAIFCPQIGMSASMVARAENPVEGSGAVRLVQSTTGEPYDGDLPQF